MAGVGGDHAILRARAKKRIDIYEPEPLVAVCARGMANFIVGRDQEQL